MSKSAPTSNSDFRTFGSVLCLLLMVLAGSSSLVAEASEMEFGRIPYLLFQFKFDPESVTDAEMSRLTMQQAMNDQQAHLQIATQSKTVEDLKAAGMSGRQTDYYDMQIKDLRAGIVFDREEVESVDLQQALPELSQKYRQTLSRLAAELPDTFACDFPQPANSYQYDSASGGLTFPVNSFPCQWMNDPSCPPNPNGTHFFLTPNNVMRHQASAAIPGLDGYFPFRPNKVDFQAGFDTNPYRFPRMLGTANRAVVALDHNIALPFLSMSADTANALSEEGMTEREHRGVAQRIVNQDKPFVSVIRFRPVGVSTGMDQLVVAELLKIEIFSPGGTPIKIFEPGDFPAAAAK